MTDTRLLTFDQYLEIFDDLRDDDEDVRFIVGTQATRRDWGDMVHEYAELNGLHGLRQLAEDPDAALEDDHEPHTYLEEPRVFAERTGKWIGDVAFPRFAFADQDTTDDLESADRTLIATTFYAADDVNTTHPQVFDVDQFEQAARDVLEQYDADDHAVFVGGFAPTGSYQFSNLGPIMRASATIYPTQAFTDTTGMSSLDQGKTYLYGTIVIAREHLSDDANAMLEGDVDEIGPDQDREQGDGVEA